MNQQFWVDIFYWPNSTFWRGSNCCDATNVNGLQFTSGPSTPTCSPDQQPVFCHFCFFLTYCRSQHLFPLKLLKQRRDRMRWWQVGIQNQGQELPLTIHGNIRILSEYLTNTAICCDNRPSAVGLTSRPSDITVSVNWLRFEWWLNHVWASPAPPVKMISAPLHTNCAAAASNLLAPRIFWVFETNLNLLNSDRYLLTDKYFLSRRPVVPGQWVSLTDSTQKCHVMPSWRFLVQFVFYWDIEPSGPPVLLAEVGVGPVFLHPAVTLNRRE